MTVLGAVLALIVGITLGLFGGGGAVLTIPVFVYALGVPEKSAVPMSLFVIGTASAIGAAERWRRREVRPSRGVPFGLAAMAGAFVGARIGVGVPARIQMSLFAVVVIVAAVRMLQRAHLAEIVPRAMPPGLDYLVFVLIGMLTSIIGVGGGFLFVPALVTIVGVPLTEATGISMMVIAMNSASALAGYQGKVEIEWRLTVSFAAIVVIATLVAGRFAPRIRVATLMRAFALVIMAVGALVLFENLR